MEKIGYIINSIKNNGPSRIVIELIENLNRELYEAVLITIFDENDSKVVENLERNNIPVIQLKKKNRLGFVLSGCTIINQICSQENIHLLHSHGFISDIVLTRGCNVPFITTIHNNLYEDYKNTYGKIKGRIYDLFHRYALKKQVNIVCCSKSVMNNLSADLNGLCYIRNGVSESKNKMIAISREDVSIPKNAIVYIYAGALSELKNILFLLREFQKNHREDEYLLILGDGKLKEEAIKFSCENIKFLGFQSNIVDYFRISDIYVSASTSEGFSISVIEALSCGLALFLSDIPSHEEIFEIKQNIYLGEIFCFQNFSQKMELLRQNKKLIDRQKIYEFYKQNLSGKAMTFGYEKRYADILESGRTDNFVDGTGR